MEETTFSKSFVAFLSNDRVENLWNLITSDKDIKYYVIEFPDKKYAILEDSLIKEILKKIGERIGYAILALPLASIPEFCQFCDFVDINQSIQIAKSKAIRSPNKQIAVLKSDKIVGVFKEQLRGALFGHIPTTLYGERFDIFEKGAVKAKYQLACPECNANFDFYEPIFEQGQMLYCCPVCKQILEK